MIQKLANHRKRGHQDGFTLIELLVVIVILGVLAAVVVFAVRGVGDKGKSNAIATDERIIRTSLESYCAQKGRYPQADAATGRDAMQVLVDDKFLSDRSTYHRLATGPDLPEGNCNGGHYELKETNPQQAPPTTLLPSVCSQANLWCDAPGPSQAPEVGYTAKSMVQLPNGKTLAIGTNGGGPEKTMIYDPTSDPAGGLGSWSDGPYDPYAYSSSGPPGISSLVLLKGDRCASNCGKVLALFNGPRLALYDPTAADLGTWEEIPTPGDEIVNNSPTSAVQILGPGCGTYCGKVLIVGAYKPLGGSDSLYVWNPADKTSQVVGYYTGLFQPYTFSIDNGKVLLLTRRQSNPKTMIFDPTSTLPLRDGPLPKCPGEMLESHSNEGRLTMNRILLACGAEISPGNLPADAPCADVQNPPVGRYCPKAEIYDPNDSTDGPDGSWSLAPSCGHFITPPPSNPQAVGGWCYILASLPDGRVLANAAQAGGRNILQHPDTWLFDPNTKRWTVTGMPRNQDSLGVGIYLSGTGCARVCNSVLTAGLNRGSTGSPKAELYSP